jgi:hypothetical protein
MTDDTSATVPAGAEPRTPRPRKLVDGMASPMDIASDTLNELIQHIGPLALLGVGQLLAAVAAMAIILPVAFGCFFGFAIGGGAVGAGVGAAGEEAEAAAAMISMGFGLVGYLLMLLIIVFGAAILLAPIHGSTVRAIDDHLHGVRTATLGGAFDTATKQLGGDIGSTVGMQLSIVLSLIAPIVGPLIAAFFLGWWALASQLDGDGIGAGARRSFAHTRAHMSWHLSYFGMAIVFGLVGGNIPVLGPMAALLYQVKSYRAAFPRQDAELVTP